MFFWCLTLVEAQEPELVETIWSLKELTLDEEPFVPLSSDALQGVYIALEENITVYDALGSPVCAQDAL